MPLPPRRQHDKTNSQGEKPLQRRYPLLAAAVFVAGSVAGTAQAEVAEIAFAEQYGISFMPLMLMEHDKLVEKQVKARGVRVP